MPESTAISRQLHHVRGHDHFYVFEIIDSTGTKQYYSVFFTLSKAGKKAGLNLFITTAHMRPELLSSAS